MVVGVAGGFPKTHTHARTHAHTQPHTHLAVTVCFSSSNRNKPSTPSGPARPTLLLSPRAVSSTGPSMPYLGTNTTRPLALTCACVCARARACVCGGGAYDGIEDSTHSHTHTHTHTRARAHTQPHTPTLVTRASASSVRSLKKMSVCSSTDARPASCALWWRVLRFSQHERRPSLSRVLSGSGSSPFAAASRRWTTTSAYLCVCVCVCVRDV